MTKISVNRALEGMGFLTSINHNLELMAHFDITFDPEQDNTIIHEHGLRDALNWRYARFKDL
jgi:hypothetical protein